MPRRGPTTMRAFDPRVVARRECGAWVTYYRRQWVRFLLYAIGMVRSGLAMSWPRTVYGAWLVLRANQLWAPAQGNDPDGARRCMRLFYELVSRDHHDTFDTAEAARLEVEWWRVHRQTKDSADGGAGVVAALTALYAHVYRLPAATVRLAASERAAAMMISDAWVADGCDPDDPALAAERAALVRSYAALLAAVHYAVG